MDKSTANRIQKLIDNSGLFSLKKNSDHTYDRFDFSKENILITGAAGSIGSELARQLAKSKFNKLILLDNAETPLYFLRHDILGIQKNNIEFILSDICDKTSMQWLFESYKPTLIFHTAAYKHVSLMEQSPYEAIKVNINATRHLASLSIQHQIKKFIFISTDKAVEPTGVMGMTKKIAEDYLQSLSNTEQTRFISARFGNIFGSNGSVVPLFMKQLEKGEPLTITEANVSRLFIDKVEACNLIQKTAMLHIEGNTKVSFDMGEPIKIVDLAQVLTEKYSLINGVSPNAHMSFTGLKAGEKLHESISSKNEVLQHSEIEGIFYISSNIDSSLVKNLELLANITPSTNKEDIKAVLREFCGI